MFAKYLVTIKSDLHSAALIYLCAVSKPIISTQTSTNNEELSAQRQRIQSEAANCLYRTNQWQLWLTVCGENGWNEKADAKQQIEELRKMAGRFGAFFSVWIAV